MLEVKKLDDTTFDEISRRARASISGYFGEWTDLNAHDPGITLIELLSWLTELQRYFIERSADAELLFNLLGVSPLCAAPSEARAELSLESAGSQLALPMGTPVYADDIRFELTGPRIVKSPESITVRTFNGEFSFSQPGIFLPFGESPKPGTSFYIMLTEHPPAGRTVLSVKTRKAPRNAIPPGSGAFLSRLEWEYLADGGFVEANVRDGTCGLLVSGDVELDINSDIRADADGRYIVRCTLKHHEYDIAPALTGLSSGVSKLLQRHSLCEALPLWQANGVVRACTHLAINGDNMLFAGSNGVYRRVQILKKFLDIKAGEAIIKFKGEAKGEMLLLSCEREYLRYRVLGELHGFPNQKLRIEKRGRFIIRDSFTLMIADGYEMNTAVLWERTDSLHRSLPGDRHFELHEQSGEIVFGDGFHGLMPSGLAIIASMALTEGAAGNIKAMRLEDFEYAGHMVRVNQEEHSDGGRGIESAEQALERAALDGAQAVTAEDYEELVRQTPGLIIERVCAFVAEDDTGAAFPVTIAVKPYGERAELPDAYRKRILSHLEPKRLAGARISVVSPVYVEVRITAELNGRTYWSDTTPVIEEKLRSYFKERHGDFGAQIRRSEVLAFLDLLPEVTKTLSLHMRTDGSGATMDRAGNLTLERRAIACLGQVDVFVY